jgi:hypothetical protein
MADFHHSEITRRKVSPPNRLRWIASTLLTRKRPGGATWTAS